MIKYDLPDLGCHYKGAATTASKELDIGPWHITNIPKDIDSSKAENDVKRFLNKICALEIPTSLKCNLRCKYCYIEDLRMKNKNVSKDIVLRILSESSKMFPGLLKQNVNKNKKAHFTAWGAEPFVNIDTLETMYEFAHEHYGKDNYKLGLSTNGTIWSKRIEQFFINAVKDNAVTDIQISLDGPPEVQNRNRPYINGKPSFQDVEKFTQNFELTMKDLNLKNKIHHFCSTIHLIDEDFDDVWIKAARFFSEPNKWWTSLPALPMRMSGEDMYGEDEINKFIRAQKLMLDLVKERAKEGILMVDFYTNKLFGNIQCKSKNAFPFCSAMNSQIGVDLDGCMYPCHGAITTPMYKPWLWFGNLFDKVISYTQMMRNIYYQFNSWNRGKCTSCPLYHYSTGSVCWSCAPHNLSVTGEPTIDNLMKCKAYMESFPYWVEIAKMNIDNPILQEIPGEVAIQASRKLKAVKDTMHFDRNFDGIIWASIRKIYGKDIPINKLHYTDTWWNFDNFNKKIQSNKGN